MTRELLLFGKSTEVAIAVMSRLAESYADETRISAASIARDRGLRGPFVGKVLSALAMAGLVTSVRGPGGGFALAQPPDKICLMDVVIIFERSLRSRTCLVGGGRCSDGAPCPVHAKFGAVQHAVDELLQETTFAVFQKKTPSGAKGTARRRKPGA